MKQNTPFNQPLIARIIVENGVVKDPKRFAKLTVTPPADPPKKHYTETNQEAFKRLAIARAKRLGIL